MKIYNNKGVTGMDISIAVVVILLFAALITTLFYNIYLSTTSTKRHTYATSYTVDVLEKISDLNYNEVTINNNFITKIGEIPDFGSKISGDISTGDYIGTISGYTITVKVIPYKQYLINNGKTVEEVANIEDVLKIITVKTEYNIGKRTEAVEISRIKTQ